MSTRIDEWMSVYREKLEEAVTLHPDLYCFPVSKVPEVCRKMKAAFEKGSYNKDGFAIKNTCKHFGIKYTYTAINAFLNGEQR